MTISCRAYLHTTLEPLKVRRVSDVVVLRDASRGQNCGPHWAKGSKVCDMEKSRRTTPLFRSSTSPVVLSARLAPTVALVVVGTPSPICCISVLARV